MQDMVEDKGIEIQYIWNEDNPADIMTKKTLKNILRGTRK